MKKICLISVIALCLILSGCAAKVSLDNVDSLENEYLYSKVSLGKLKECSEDSVIKDAKEYVNKYLSIAYTRSHESKTSVEYETSMYTDSYLEKNKDTLEAGILYTKEFYSEYELDTELVTVDYEHIVNCDGDAYVTCIAKIRLNHCNNPKVASILGFKDGVGSNASCMYNLKLEYKDKGYHIYDFEIVEKEGYLLPLTAYKDIINNTLGEEERLKHFAYLVSKAQNNRVYYEFKGDEDYPYLSKSCIEEINKDRDNAKYQKELYSSYKLSTELAGCEVTEIVKNETGYTLKVVLSVKMLECISEDVARQIGFSGGIGSIRNMNYEYYIITEDGEFKLDGSTFLN